MSPDGMTGDEFPHPDQLPVEWTTTFIIRLPRSFDQYDYLLGSLLPELDFIFRYGDIRLWTRGTCDKIL
jgi:hypothetical protein